jgi:PIN domain
MIVVFDTTETFTDLRLEGPSFRLLAAYLYGTASSLAVPKIVFEETVNHFRERLAKHVRSATDNLREIAKLTGKEHRGTEPLLNQEEAVEQYREHLAAQIKQLKGTVIGLENVSVEELVQRSLQRRKPFDGEGRKGFRDAVLWETVLREVLAKSDEQPTVALLTRNSTDFGKDGALAEALRDDCNKVGKADECVKLFDGLQAFIETEVKPHLETLEAIREQVREGGYKEFDPVEFFTALLDSIRSGVRDHLRRCDFDRLTHRMMGHVHSSNCVHWSRDRRKSRLLMSGASTTSKSQ